MEAYLPGGRWYDWKTHEYKDMHEDGDFVTMEVPLTEIQLFARGGSIVATKPEGRANTTTERYGTATVHAKVLILTAINC